jgi:hypothetical protein
MIYVIKIEIMNPFASGRVSEHLGLFVSRLSNLVHMTNGHENMEVLIRRLSNIMEID